MQSVTSSYSLKRLRKTSLLLLVASTIGLPAIARQAARTPPTATADSLVADLYRQQKLDRGPFNQYKNRSLVDKYFDKPLADLIWNDAITAQGEVGAFDGDPLYDAQDFKIRNFSIHPPKDLGAGRAEVVVSFLNIGKKVQIVFELIQRSGAWKITDIKYQDGRTMVAIYKDAAGTK
ncbi:MAG TPA: DUF3828 domain-containing protein [Blastocatellia bacterium]|nr:DUF3828 domain-containing protein [Blastocatellia bacterium]